MPNYLVRLRDGGEAVGIFAVQALDELLFWVDEVTEPAACEYAEIGSGSVIYEGAAESVPLPDHDWDSEPRSPLDVIGQHSLGGHWLRALISGDAEFFPCIEDAESPANDA